MQSTTQLAKSSGLLQATVLVPICQRLNVERGVGACKSAKVGKDPRAIMDRPKPGGGVVPSAECAEWPASTFVVGSLHN